MNPLHLLLSVAVLGQMAATAWSETRVKETIRLEVPPAPKEWWVTLAADSWVTAVDGTLGIRGFDVSADMGMDEVLKNLEFAYMGFVEAGYRRWSLGVDGIYARLSDSQSFRRGPLSAEAKLKQEQAFITVRAQYRLVQAQRWTLDGFAGFRWNYLSFKTDLTTRLDFQHPLLERFNRTRTRNFNLSEDWFDPIVGMRSVIRLTDHWFVQTAGDIGGFGVGSRLTWQALGGIGYEFSNGFSTLVGYRALAIDYSKGNFRVDTVSHGPLVAIAYTF